MKNKGIFYALGAGIAWGGSLGIFVRAMSSLGFSSMKIAAVRTTISALTFIILTLIKTPKAFKIELKDSWIFLCSGFISINLFCWLYCTTAEHCSLAVAGILQYTAPIWVVIMSAIFFKEKITRVKVVAMIIAIIGCALVSGITDGIGSVSGFGIVTGLLSGLAYGLYTIFVRFAVPKYSTMTISTYSFIVASLSSLSMAGPVQTVKAVCTPEILPTAVIGGVLCAAVPYFLYTKAMEMLDNGKASIYATIEPVVAAMVSVFYFKEPISVAAVIGIFLILAAVILLAVYASILMAMSKKAAAHEAAMKEK